MIGWNSHVLLHTLLEACKIHPLGSPLLTQPYYSIMVQVMGFNLGIIEDIEIVDEASFRFISHDT
jgi:hypothetical protein